MCLALIKLLIRRHERVFLDAADCFADFIFATTITATTAAKIMTIGTKMYHHKLHLDGGWRSYLSSNAESPVHSPLNQFLE